MTAQPPALETTSLFARLVDADRCNLTNGQLVIWTGQRLNPELPCYDNAVVFTIDGPLDAHHFNAAFQALVDRADAFRTVIEEDDGVPVQRILRDVAYPVTHVTFADAPDPEAALHAWMADRSDRPPRLAETLSDTALVDLGHGRTAWYLRTHHLAFDGASCALIFGHLADFYRRSREGTLGDAPALAQFRDYVALEQDARRSSAWSRADAYWNDVLSRPYEPVEFYGVGPASRTREERWVSVDLGEARTAALRSYASLPAFRSLNDDLSLLGIFSNILLAYLYRVSGVPDLSIGLPFHNRDTDTEATIGLVQQMYPLPVHVEPAETFASLGRKTMRGVWNIIRHAPHGSGNPTHQAVNDVMLNYFPISFPSFDGLRTDAELVPRRAADGSHSLQVQVSDLAATGSFRLDVTFNAGVFAERQRTAAMSHLLNVVDQFIADPTGPLDAVDLLSPEERRLVLVERNATHADWPADKTVDALVAAQAALTPDDPAVQCGTDALTYAALDARANALAHHLQSVGVAPGVVVGVYAERCIDLIVSVLAIFKAGGAYLPLDTSYPDERIEFILRDSRASVLVTQKAMRAIGRESIGTVIELDDLDALVAAQPGTAPQNRATPEDLAYVIYTSGSTGLPKGAAVPQRALVNVIWWQANRASLLRRPRCLQFSPLSFDVSLQELFATWCAGGTLVVPTGDIRRDPDALLRVLRDADVEQLYTIFTPLQQLAEAVERLDVAPEGLREVFTAGEQVTITPAVERFFERLPRCRFQNQYGSSEDLIITSYTLTGPPSTWPRLPPIGTPIANTSVYLLDGRGEPVPAGVAGEICIGGAQVSLGYLHRPELTAERFVPCPFSDEAGARMFKQGDLARYLPDGNIQFLGRMDNQIKLRGFRIEPGEIEAALCGLDGVDEAVVVAREDEPGEKRLVAYLVAPDWSPARLPDVHRALLARFPQYMMPAAFVVLDELPKTASGKLDRRALPRPDPRRPELETEYDAPQGELETAIAQIWADALGIDRVGRHDNFFSLGGHSLLLVQVHIRVEELTGRSLPPVALLDAPTVAQFASLLGDAAWPPPWRSLVPLRARGSKRPLFFVPGVFGLAVSFRELVEELDEERPFYALQARGLAGDAPATRIDEMAKAYVEEIRTVQPCGPYLVGGACFGARVAFEMARQLAADGDDVAKVLLVESYAPGIRGFPLPSRVARVRRRLTRLRADTETFGPRAGLELLRLRTGRGGGKRLMRTGGDVPLVRSVAMVRRANIGAVLAYVPPPYPGGVTVVRGTHGDEAPDRGWAAFAEGGVEVIEVSGSHGAVLRPPHVRALAGALERCLDDAGL